MPEPVDARGGGAGTAGLAAPAEHHPYPTCFVCGPEREAGDGSAGDLRAGVRTATLVAAPFETADWMAGDGTAVRDELVWSVLDCPSGIAGMLEPEVGVTMLGRLTAELRCAGRGGRGLRGGRLADRARRSQGATRAPRSSTAKGSRTRWPPRPGSSCASRRQRERGRPSRSSSSSSSTASPSPARTAAASTTSPAVRASRSCSCTASPSSGSCGGTSSPTSARTTPSSPRTCAASTSPTGRPRSRPTGCAISSATSGAWSRSSGIAPFTLVGHDWGGIVSWAFALKYPELLERLVIIDSPPPFTWNRDLRESPKQREAVNYMVELSRPLARAGGDARRRRLRDARQDAASGSAAPTRGSASDERAATTRPGLSRERCRAG